MKAAPSVLFALALLVPSFLLYAQEQDKHEPSIWMKQKLKASQAIFAGLAREDFDAISENAGVLKQLNRIEAFVRRKPNAYRTQLKLFQFANDELLRNSESENLDGATLAFTQMTVSCVNCHKQLRHSKGTE